MMNFATFGELKSTASRRCSAHERAVFSMEIGNKCSTFGRLNVGVNSDMTSILLTFKRMGSSELKSGIS